MFQYSARYIHPLLCTGIQLQSKLLWCLSERIGTILQCALRMKPTGLTIQRWEKNEIFQILICLVVVDFMFLYKFCGEESKPI